MVAVVVPQTQIAAVVSPQKQHGGDLVQINRSHPVPVPGKDEILVKLEYSGVCHSDLHSIVGDTPMLTDVAGHEGVGRVVKVGSNVEQSWMGKRVGISSCMQCEICQVNNTACPFQKNAGANVPGTFQQYIVSPAAHVTKIPEELAPEAAAPLLCAGIAMYSSIIKTRTKPGDWLVLPGAGGGLGHMGIQIAVKKGLKVIAIDSGESKRQLCLSLGATAFLDYRTDSVEAKVKSLTSGLGAHAVICTANSEPAYEQSLCLLRRLGTLVCVGIPSTPFRLPATPFDMIVKAVAQVKQRQHQTLKTPIGLTIVGNSAGTAAEMEGLMEMAVAADVRAHVKAYELAEINEVLQKLGRSEIDGRAVLKIPD